MVDYRRKISDILCNKAEIFLSLPANEPLNTIIPSPVILMIQRRTAQNENSQVKTCTFYPRKT